jgi:hypothetical protein
VNRLAIAACNAALGAMSALAIAIPAPAWSQATYEGRDINVEGYVRDRASDGPRGEPGGGRGNGDRSGSSRSGGGRTATTPALKTTVVYVGGQEYRVSMGANADLAAFISEYRQVNGIGQLVSAFAGLFALFNTVNIDSSNPIAEAVYNPSMTAFSPDELVLTLSATSVWQKAMRTKAVNFLRLKMLDAASKPGGQSEFKMWKALREIIEFPERYQEGGLRRGPAGAVWMRASTGAGIARVAGSPVWGQDQAPLANLTSQMLSYPEAHAWVWQADYWYHLFPGNGGVGALSMRDEMLINQALYAAGPNTKRSLAFHFNQLRNTMGHSPLLWSRMGDYLYDPKAWQDNVFGPIPYQDDPNGFDDELPYATDLLTG